MRLPSGHQRDAATQGLLQEPLGLRGLRRMRVSVSGDRRLRLLREVGDLAFARQCRRHHQSRRLRRGAARAHRRGHDLRACARQKRLRAPAARDAPLDGEHGDPLGRVANLHDDLRDSGLAAGGGDPLLYESGLADRIAGVCAVGRVLAALSLVLAAPRLPSWKCCPTGSVVVAHWNPYARPVHHRGCYLCKYCQYCGTVQGWEGWLGLFVRG